MECHVKYIYIYKKKNSWQCNTTQGQLISTSPNDCGNKKKLEMFVAGYVALNNFHPTCVSITLCGKLQQKLLSATTAPTSLAGTPVCKSELNPRAPLDICIQNEQFVVLAVGKRNRNSKNITSY